MLYLEDYLELIEPLPQELRDRFTEIRERDLQVHNSTEQLREKEKLLFAEAKKLEPEQRQCDYEKLLSDYQETMSYAADKVQIAEQMHEIMVKLVQRLDTELEKFKLELEADHAGITEELEKRSLELDADSRRHAPNSISGDINGFIETGHYGSNISSFGNNSGFKNSSKKSNLHNSFSNHQPISQQHSALSAALGLPSKQILSAPATPQLNSVSALAMMNATSVHSKISNDLGGDALIDPNSVPQDIAAAASQALAATQQLHHGRRTPSMKASIAAFNSAGLGQLDSLSKKQDATTGNSRNALAPVSQDQQAAYRYNQYGKLIHTNGNSNPLYISVTKPGRPTKRPRHASHLYPNESPTSISSDNSVFENSESLSSTDYIETGTTFGSASPSSLDFATNATQGNTTLYHRDETKYCVCRQTSYGEMVACDNNECENEWFHYDCVGITQPPKGKWFCPDCTRKMTGHQQHPNHQHQASTQKKRGRKEKSLFNLVNNTIE